MGKKKPKPKKSRPVNVNKRVNKAIRAKKVPRLKESRKGGYTRKQLQSWIDTQHYPKGTKVVTDAEYDAMPGPAQHRALSYTDAVRHYQDYRHDWFNRFTASESRKRKHPVTITYIDRKTGEEKERKKFVYRSYRDSKTGRFVSYKDVKAARYEMRKELTIHNIALRKKISVADARAIFADFEDTGTERYLMREYAKTPE